MAMTATVMLGRRGTTKRQSRRRTIQQRRPPPTRTLNAVLIVKIFFRQRLKGGQWHNRWAQIAKPSHSISIEVLGEMTKPRVSFLPMVYSFNDRFDLLRKKGSRYDNAPVAVYWMGWFWLHDTFVLRLRSAFLLSLVGLLLWGLLLPFLTSA